jgi:hypothetical protein
MDGQNLGSPVNHVLLRVYFLALHTVRCNIFYCIGRVTVHTKKFFISDLAR